MLPDMKQLEQELDSVLDKMLLLVSHYAHYARASMPDVAILADDATDELLLFAGELKKHNENAANSLPPGA